MILARLMIILVALLNLFVLLIYPGFAMGFSTNIHQIINKNAAEGSPVLDEFLRSTFGLGFPAGRDTSILGRTVVEWIERGGVAEDEFRSFEFLGGLSRSPRHFHTPLPPMDDWGQAGLGLGAFESSVRWAQNPSQFPGRRASWIDARETYFRALTSRLLNDRRALFAEMFLDLGQVMHLVADLASPAHTRNDAHLPGNSDDFERFMARNPGLVTGFTRVDPAILRQPTGDGVARVPVARLWDTNRYNGTNPDVTIESTVDGATIGLAEFTSANFFSDDSVINRALLDPVLPYPGIDRLDPGPRDIYPPTGRRRQYLSKQRDGFFPITHMAAQGPFNRFLPEIFRWYILDDLVYLDYAPVLLPRAIGYTSAVLDYFFRGRLEKLCCSPMFGDPITQLTLRGVRNITPNEETGQGDLVAIVIGRSGDEDTHFVSAPLTGVTLTRDFQEFTFDFSANPIPRVGPFHTAVVFRGRLGEEEQAVIVAKRCTRLRFVR